MEKGDYLIMRNKYLPKKIKIVFILESPPVSGKYFYNPGGKVTEPLFRNMMKCVVGINPIDKDMGLQSFAEAGYFLVDSTYTSVNDLSNKERDEQIEKDYPSLVEDLKNIIGGQKVKVIIVKANVCRLLEKRLLNDGFNIINSGEVVPFPACGRQNEFCRKIKDLVK